MIQFICKPNESIQDYNGYMILIDKSSQCWIIERIRPDKFKKRRAIMGAYTHRCDCYGNKLYKSISVEDAIIKAKFYIDNHIKPWSERLIELKRIKEY